MDKEITPKGPQAQKEEAILSFWKENNIFEKTLQKDSPKGEYNFYEGPPTANGKPGIHHVEARSFKDVIPRYKTMRGYHVARRAGWDTHGLPVELQVEKTLGFTSKKDIEEYGIAEFNKKCKESVFEYIDLWKKFTERIGYWADLDRAYFTFHNSYINELWGVVGKVSEQNLLYKDYRIAPWCPRCGTILSSHELAQGYQDVKDLTVYVKFKIVGEDNTYILAWTTTPWTLPGNVALAVGKDIEYVKIEYKNLATIIEGGEIIDGKRSVIDSIKKDEVYIVAKERLGVLHAGYEIIETIKGSDLVGLSYEPLFPFLKDNLADSEKSKLEKAFKVYEADFVTTTDGTGVVHTAVMYGQDDFVLGTKVGLPKQHTVKADGTFYEWCGKYAGRFVKEVDEKGKPLVAVDVINDLKEKNYFFKQENYSHSYPHCWRCKTPLIYYARDSWYIAMSKLRDKLVAENEHINWEPEYIKEGRFGEWLREIKDWAISRERYWGTPLPVWINEAGDKRIIVDGVDTLKKYTRKSGNTYKLMRHGKTEKNELSVWDCNPKSNAHLSEEGKRGVIEAVERLKEEGCAPDMVFVSPFLRTEETMRIVCDALNIPKENIFEDSRLVEWYVGSEWNGKSIEGYFAALYDSFGKDFHYSKFGDGETYADVVKRAGEFLYEVDAKYKNKKILIVSHASVLKAFSVLGNVLDTTSIAAFHNEYPKYKNSEIRNLDFVPLPHNENYEIDLHRPFIDEIVLVDEDGVEYRRTKEVMDVWFDSGAMPFAQDATFGNKRHDFAYPADFISEAIDQTRGWFYTLHAVGVLMGKGNAYKNVICLGHLLDKNGKKMSKSLGNVVDPWEQINKFGIDAIRLWMYSVNQPGESKNYDEKTVDEINKKIFNLITNVHTFYELYRDTTLESNNYPVSRDVMDRWILEKLNILVQRIVKNMDAYKLLEPVREIRDFVADLSTWYLQLSRDRFRDGDQGAKTTLYFVLKTMARVLAPFAPFYAEDLYLKLRIESDVESVHLESFPEGTGEGEDTDLLIDMEKTRKIVSLALEARQTVGIKVRQPLSKLKIKDQKLEVGDEFSVLIKERVNVKDIIVDESIQNEVELDTEITNDLREEGIVREIIRAVQDLRKSKGLTPSDPIILNIGANEKGKDVLEKPEWLVMIRDAVLAKNIEVKTITEGEKIVIDDVEFTIALV